jgi:hypothetical protein
MTSGFHSKSTIRSTVTPVSVCTHGWLEGYLLAGRHGDHRMDNGDMRFYFETNDGPTYLPSQDVAGGSTRANGPKMSSADKDPVLGDR